MPEANRQRLEGIAQSLLEHETLDEAGPRTRGRRQVKRATRYGTLSCQS